MRLHRPEVLLLDVGNTMLFLDMEAVATIAVQHSLEISAEALQRAEGQAKREYEAYLYGGGNHDAGWGLYLRILLCNAGTPEAAAYSLIPHLRAAHDRLNLWRSMSPSLPTALERVRDAGIRLAVVSNSEGQLPALFEHVGLKGYFETIIDSAWEGIHKPNPEIFHRAAERMSVAPNECLYAGDLPRVDVQGAQAAGLQAALIDPWRFYPNHQTSPRFDSVEKLIEMLLIKDA